MIGKIRRLFQLLRELNRLPGIEARLDDTLARSDLHPDVRAALKDAATAKFLQRLGQLKNLNPVRPHATTVLEVAGLKLCVLAKDHMTDLMAATMAEAPFTEEILGAILSRFGSVHYVDVGCNFGLDMMLAAKFLASKTQHFRITAFDPGEAAELVPVSLRLNGLNGLIDFRPVAIADQPKEVQIFGEDGHSENNRIVNQSDDSNIIRICEAITLDDYLETTKSNFPLFIKIDTQGGEIEVFEGLKRTIQSQRPLFSITEFTPWALDTRMRPVEFLKQLGQTFDIVDIGSKRDRFTDVDIGKPEPFVEEISENAPYWIDLVLAPKGHMDLLRNLPSSQSATASGKAQNASA